MSEYGGITSKLPATTLTLVLLVCRARITSGGRQPAPTCDAADDCSASPRSDAGRIHGVVGRVDRRAGSQGAGRRESVERDRRERVAACRRAHRSRAGNTLLLCTDGLTKHVSDEEIESALARGDSAVSTSTKLVEDALAGGGTDNVTVVVVQTAPR